MNYTKNLGDIVLPKSKEKYTMYDTVHGVAAARN